MGKYLNMLAIGLLYGLLADYIFTNTTIFRYSYVMYFLGLIIGLLIALTLDITMDRRRF